MATSKLVLRLENVSPNVTESHLRELFEPFSRVAKVLMPEAVLWMTVPIGRVEMTFETESDAVNAFAHLNGVVIDGSKVEMHFVRIKLERPKSPRRRRSDSRDRRRRRSPPPRKRSRDKKNDRQSSRERRRRSPSPRSPSSRSRSSRSASGSPDWN